ncbi:hypothetical protein [Rurimicrobium arvi]|uniref:YcxB-like protein n=1 Tax=Rurimicrobium arvi TaxID=2049916 RepID=A0ABP8MFG2_9BACT
MNPKYRLGHQKDQGAFSPLLEDIAFIKKHLRYPVNKFNRYILQSAIGILVLVLVLLTSFVIGQMYSPRSFRPPMVMPFFAIIFMIRFSIISLRSMRFRRIGTSMNTNGNTELIRDFLTHCGIAYFQSPLAPEVFQISSRPLNYEGTQREIMVFIADDLQILLNSHYTDGPSRSVPLKFSTEYRNMERALRDWLEQRQIPGIVSARRFRR